MIARIRRNFVPVALNLYKIRKDKGTAGEFFQKVAKQTPRLYQGLYVVDGEGKVLASRGQQPKSGSWAKDTLKMLDDGLEGFGKVSPRKVTVVDPKPYRGLGLRENGSIVLAVYTRPMTLGLDRRGLGAPAIDSIVLKKSEWSGLTPEEVEAGIWWEVPVEVVRAFHKVLSPTSDANNLAGRDEVKKAKMKGKVERIRDGIATLSFNGEISGEHEWQFDPHKGKKIRAEVKLTGAGTLSVKTGRLLSLTLVGDGTYRHHAPYDKASKYGAVVKWQAK